MSKDGSIAPKERINIRYVPATGDQKEEVELPLRMMMLGDYLGNDDDTPLEERDVLSIDKNSFSTVLKEAGIKKDLSVQNTLSDDPDATLAVSLSVGSMDDFSPDKVAQQVPEIKSLVDLREALVALKGPLGNMPAFRKRIESLLTDEESRKALLEELAASESQEPSAEAAPEDGSGDEPSQT